jgi:hypothetical protein
MRQDACEYNVCVEVLCMQIGLKSHCLASEEEIQQKATVGLIAITKTGLPDVHPAVQYHWSVYVHKGSMLRMLKFEEVFDPLMYFSHITLQDVKFLQK